MGKVTAKDFFHIPVVKDDTMRLVCMLLDILICGLGTIIAGALDNTNIMVILCGIVQMILASAYGIGYIWSWFWAYFIWTKKQACK